MKERLKQLARKVQNTRPGRRSGTWSICSMVAEPPELLCVFAAYYLELGAQEVHFYLDDPHQAGVDMLKAIDGVRLTYCDDAFWARLGGRPKGQVMRQVRVFNQGYRACPSEWVLFCDADEYFFSDVPVAALLGAVLPEIAHCRTRMAERVFRAETAQAHLFDGVGRVPLNKSKVLEAVYGDRVEMTTRGLTGHVLGKSFVRTGRGDLRMRVHFPVPTDPDEEKRQRAAGTLKPGPDLEGGRLVHFDGMTSLHWRLKLLRFYLDYAPQLKAGEKVVFARRTPARSNQMNAVFLANGDPVALRRLGSLIELGPQQRAILADAGALMEHIPDPRIAARARLGHDLPISPAQFNARLIDRHGPLIEEYGLMSDAQ